MYHLRILDAAVRDLDRQDRSVGARIVNRLHWLAENLDEILAEEGTILVHAIGHRREIYRSK
jgi:mRNA interferase RelE/StbE